jgi:hypothetical protein
MGGTKENGILKGDQRLWSLRITDKTSKDKFKKHSTYPKGDIQYSSRNNGTTQAEKGEIEETKNTTTWHVYTTIMSCWNREIYNTVDLLCPTIQIKKITFKVTLNKQFFMIHV